MAFADKKEGAVKLTGGEPIISSSFHNHSLPGTGPVDTNPNSFHLKKGESGSGDLRLRGGIRADEVMANAK